MLIQEGIRLFLPALNLATFVRDQWPCMCGSVSALDTLFSCCHLTSIALQVYCKP